MAKQQRLDATITIGSVLQKSVGKNLNVVRKGLDSVGDEIKGVIDRQKELSKQRKVLERQGKSVDELDREYEQLGRTLDELKRKQDRYARAQKAGVQVGSSFKTMTREVGKVARNSAIGLAAAGAAVFKLSSDTAALGDDVAKNADKLGFSIEGFQELRYAAERSGVSVATFDSSMTTMQKRLGEAAQGSGAAIKGLDMLGLSAKDLIKLAPEDALGVIADRMQQIENPADRATVAAAFFSKQGIGMVNMLKDGSKGLFRLREDARRTGNVLTEKAARGAEVYQDSLLNAQLSAKGLKNTVGAALMPAVTTAMDQFSAFMQSNRDEVERFATLAGDKLTAVLPVIGDLASGVGKVSTQVGTVVTKVADMVGGWENFGIIIGGVMASKAILSIGAFAGSVFSLGRAMWALAPALPIVAGGIQAIGVALFANPIGLAIGAAAAIAGAGYLIWKNWGEIKSKFGPLVDWIGAKIKWLWDGATRPVVDAMKTGIDGIVAGWEAMKSGLGSVIDWIGAKFDWLGKKIKPVLDGLRWIGDKGGSILGKIGIGGGDDPTKRAIGGAFGRGPLLVGERGPELRYENQGGFIAHNRALERLRDMSQQVTSGGGRAASGGQSLTQNITINALGTSAREIIDELERLKRRAASGALFDGATSYGQYG